MFCLTSSDSTLMSIAPNLKPKSWIAVFFYQQRINYNKRGTSGVPQPRIQYPRNPTRLMVSWIKKPSTSPKKLHKDLKRPLPNCLRAPKEPENNTRCTIFCRTKWTKPCCCCSIHFAPLNFMKNDTWTTLLQYTTLFLCLKFQFLYEMTKIPFFISLIKSCIVEQVVHISFLKLYKLKEKKDRPGVR